MNLTITQEEVEVLRQMRLLQKAFFTGDKHVVGQCKAFERQSDEILAKFPTDNGLFAETDKDE